MMLYGIKYRKDLIKNGLSISLITIITTILK